MTALDCMKELFPKASISLSGELMNKAKEISEKTGENIENCKVWVLTEEILLNRIYGYVCIKPYYQLTTLMKPCDMITVETEGALGIEHHKIMNSGIFNGSASLFSGSTMLNVYGVKAGEKAPEVIISALKHIMSVDKLDAYIEMTKIRLEDAIADGDHEDLKEIILDYLQSNGFRVNNGKVDLIEDIYTIETGKLNSAIYKYYIEIRTSRNACVWDYHWYKRILLDRKGNMVIVNNFSYGFGIALNKIMKKDIYLA